MKLKYFITLFVFALVAIVSSVHAEAVQDEATIRAGGFLDWKDIQAATSKIEPGDYPDADSVIVDDDIRTSYEADGTSVTWDDTVIKILTEAGTEKNRILELYIHEGFMSSEFVFVQILKANGDLQTIDLERYQSVMIDDSSIGSNIYDPTRKLVKISLPNLARGDVIRYLSRTEVTKNRLPDSFSDYQTFESDVPIIHYSYAIDGPEELPLRHTVVKDRLGDHLTQTMEKKNGRCYRRWELKDMPQAFPEPDMPPLYTCVQRLLVSTLDSWQAVSRWYWNISEPHLAVTPEISAKVAELCNGLQDDQEKIRAIYDFVAQQIRYMGITLETESPGSEPHDVGITFSNRHGVCRDKAALLVAMLREAGFQAFPVLINVGRPPMDEEVPQPYFNHAVTAVQHADGSYQLMDSTNEHSTELFPSYLCDCSYLVARPEGEKLQTSPVPSYLDNRMDISTHGRLAADGHLFGESLMVFNGINDNAYRGMLLNSAPEQRRTFFETALKRAMPGATLLDIRIEPENLQDMSRVLQITLGFEVKDVLIDSPESAILQMPVYTNIGIMNFVIGGAELKERRFPFECDFTCGISQNISLELPLEWGKVRVLPKPCRLESGTMLWEQNVTAEGNVLKMSQEEALLACRLSPEEYRELKSFLVEVEEKSRHRVILGARKTLAESAAEVQEEPAAEPEPDYYVESDESRLRLNEDGSWELERSVCQHILTYKGVKDRSELHFRFNPAWESIEIISAEVENDGIVQKVSQPEINLMDAPWAASSPRYPASRELVVSFPGVRFGSIIRFRYREKSAGRGFFRRNEVFQSVVPIGEKVLTLEVPRHLALIWKYYPAGSLKGEKAVADEGISPVLYEREKDDTFIRHTWRVENQKALRREPLELPGYAVCPMVCLTIGKWKDYADTLKETFLARAFEAENVTEDIQALNDGEGIALQDILDCLEHQLRRSAFPYTELPLGCFSPADLVWQDGYGHNADRALLYYAALRAAGFRPEIVLVAPGESLKHPDIQKFWLANPSPDIFSDILIRVKTRHGEVWLNELDKYGVLGTTAYEGSLAYSLTKNKFFRMEAMAGFRTETAEQIIVDVKPDGSAKITFRERIGGFSCGIQRGRYEEMLPEERRRHYQAILAGISQSAEPLSPLKTDFRSYPGEMEFTASVRNFAVTEGEYCYFTLPVDLNSLVRVAGDRREKPLFLGGTQRETTEVRIRLPWGFPVIEKMPAELKWQSPDGRSHIRLEQQKTESDGEICYVLDTEIQPMIVRPNEYPALLALKQLLGSQETTSVLLRKK